MDQERLNSLIELIKSGTLTLPPLTQLGQFIKSNRDIVLPHKEKFNPIWLGDGNFPDVSPTFKTEVIKYNELAQLITTLGLPAIKAPDPIWEESISDFYPTFKPWPTFYPYISPNIQPIFPTNFVYISGLEDPVTYELREEAPEEPITEIAKAIWEAIWDDPFPDILVIWGEHDWAPYDTMGDWSEERQRIRISFNNHIRSYRGEDEIRGKRNTGLIYTIVHELLHVRGLEHKTLGLPSYAWDKVHDIYALEVDKALNILWEKIK